MNPTHLTPARLLALLLVLLLWPAGHALAGGHCAILQYHHVSERTPASTSVTPAQFEAHLDFLAREGFTVRTLDEVVAALRSRGPLPDRCIAFSFDDAYASVYAEAAPRLAARGWPYTVFVTTQGVDAGLSSYMTWAQMRELAAQGASFENHSHSHDHLIRRRPGETEPAWRERVREDLLTAGQRIEDELGRPSSLFAYPYGEFDGPLAALVAELGLTGFGQHSGPAGPDDDLRALPRFAMAVPYAALEGFRDKVLSLPMPLRQPVRAESLLPLGELRPTLRLELEPGRYRAERLRCFANGSDRVRMAWPDGQPDTLEVRSEFDLPVGRSRYNCTLPSATPGRFHWLSQQWIRRHPDGRWYAE
jgi:poly-beta-1,6-N-acetyl-D-glucosamine N-deacetylase